MVTNNAAFDESLPSDDATQGTKNDGQDPLSLLVRCKHVAVGTDHPDLVTTQFCATNQASSMESDDNRAPVDIVVALDVSGSMQGEKLALCKETVQRLLQFLTPRDRFGLATFDTNAQLDFSLQYMTPEKQAAALQIIRRVTYRGSTNISAALALSTSQLHQSSRGSQVASASATETNAVRALFLLTDGNANMGITDHVQLLTFFGQCLKDPAFGQSQIELVSGHGSQLRGTPAPSRAQAFNSTSPAPTAAAVSSGSPSIPTTVTFTTPTATTGAGAEMKEHATATPISTQCFGYGTDHDAALLQAMAEASLGGYYFVEKQADVGGAFGDALGGIMSVVAQQVVLHIQVPNSDCSSEARHFTGIEIVKVHGGDMSKAAVAVDSIQRHDDGSYSVILGDMYAEESRDVVVEVLLAKPVEGTDAMAVDKAPPIPHVQFSVSYVDTIRGVPMMAGPVVGHVARPVGATDAILSVTDAPYIESHLLRVFAAMQIATADELAATGNLKEAREAMQAIQTAIDELSAEAQQSELVRWIAQEAKTTTESGLSSAEQYQTKGSSSLKHRQHGMMQQRCQEVSMQQANYFRVGNKEKYTTLMSKKSEK
jgi:von Willebrand factor type A domain